MISHIKHRKKGKIENQTKDLWCWATVPLEIQCKQEAALLIQQLPKTWLLCLPLRLAHTLLPHSTPHSIHSYTTYNTIRHTRREENKLQAKIEESQLWLGFAESLSHYSLCITSHVFIWRPSSVFPPPLLCFGRSSWHVGDKWPVYGQYCGVGAPVRSVTA